MSENQDPALGATQAAISPPERCAECGCLLTRLEILNNAVMCKDCEDTAKQDSLEEDDDEATE